MAPGCYVIPDWLKGERVRRWAELTALSSFAISQPLLSAVGEDATFLVAHDVDGPGLVTFGFAVILLPALLAIVVDELILFVARDRYPMFGSSLRGLLLGLLLTPVLVRAGWVSGYVSILALLALSAAGAALLARVSSARSVVRVAGVAPLVFLTWFLFATPASAILTAGATGPAEVRGSPTTSVVWLVFDQFPLAMMVEADGSLDTARFPNFARLAATSTWYPNALTVSTSTAVAVPSALSGQIGEHDTLPVVSQYPVNLFTLLGSTHEVHAFETFTQLCPDSVCEQPDQHVATGSLMSDTWVVLVRLLLADRVADRFVPDLGTTWAGFGHAGLAAEELTVVGEATTADEAEATRERGDDRVRFEEFLDGLGRETGPAVHYIHLEKPHEPLILLPDGRSYDFCSCYGLDADGRWPDDPAMTRQRLQRYLLQAMYVDTLVGRVLDALDSSGLGEEAILVVMSDHGVSLLPGSPNRVLTSSTAADVLPVPLFVKAPGQVEGRVDRGPAQISDIIPTVLEMMGASVSSDDMPGESLLGARSASRPLLIVDEPGQSEMRAPPSVTDSPLIPWMVELFPDPGNPYAFGPFADLFGEQADAVVSGESDLAVEILTDGRISSREISDVYAPAHVIGTVHGSDRPVEVAIAVGGRVAGLGTTFWHDRWWLSVMLDPAMIPDTESTIEVFEIGERGLLRLSVP